MKLGAIGMGRFLRVSSALVILGLIVEIISLLWFHPLSFVLFAFVGVILIGLGIAVYLVSLLFAAQQHAGTGGAENPFRAK
ncbi:MAG TPA: hypothetical protein VMJ93_17300 [Verrucomicrobiae bacterium]|nr:hypothetical protein [Verrucomicrobiae bacterium]